MNTGAARKSAQGRHPGSGATSLEKRIRGCYESLPNSERQVADLLLDFPGQLATHSATEIAKLSGASKAAVTRLVQRLGYPTYAQARTEVRNAQQWGSPVYLDIPVDPAESAAPSALAAHLAADSELLRKTLESLASTDLEALADALGKARRVLVIGHRNSALLATYLRGQLGLLRAAVELAPMHGETLAEGLLGLGPEDLLLAVGFRRRVPAFLAALEVGRRAGTRIAVITDPSGAALARNADWVLPCHCRGASIFDSYVAAVSLINYLASQLAARLGQPARARLREIESLHEELGDLI
jgi:DNA-binding MurR/RpiR family transcriptional regulator